MRATVSLPQKIFYAAVAVLALWVGAWGYFAPAQVDLALPWLIPPLHARFLGAMYLSGTTFMIGAMLAREWPAIRVVVPMISIWTGMLFIVSLFHLGEFDWGRRQTWIWFAAYLVYPLVAAWIAWRMRSHLEHGDGPPLPNTLRRYLIGQGLVATLLALFLLVLPGVAVRVWPWATTPLLAQIYSAPFLSYGLGSLYAARQTNYGEVQIGLVATFVFAAGVLLASLIHRALFSTAHLSTWLWFLGFGVATLALGIASILPVLQRRAVPLAHNRLS
jgi:hypothetical protein